MNKQDFLQKLKKAVLLYDAKAEVILYGSRARGDFREDSDWDILVLTEKEADFVFQRKIRDEICEVELEYAEPISTIIMNKDRWRNLEISRLYKNVSIDGKKI
ncbi:MAG: polymerase subunit beta [Flaviaesturariibacter sp.]|nr:polymerase subunit beta [Flaviaesturariibacter sp.]